MSVSIIHSRHPFVFFVLRGGLAFSLFYAAYAGFVDPVSWLGYLPGVPFGLERGLVLELWGVSEIILGLWLVSGRYIFIPSVITAVSFVLVILFNLSQFSILFRDVSLFSISLALAIESSPFFLKDEEHINMDSV